MPSYSPLGVLVVVEHMDPDVYRVYEACYNAGDPTSLNYRCHLRLLIILINSEGPLWTTQTLTRGFKVNY